MPAYAHDAAETRYMPSIAVGRNALRPLVYLGAGATIMYLLRAMRFAHRGQIGSMRSMLTGRVAMQSATIALAMAGAGGYFDTPEERVQLEHQARELGTVVAGTLRPLQCEEPTG